jgi:sugar phosphate isomerase/epimerase
VGNDDNLRAVILGEHGILACVGVQAKKTPYPCGVRQCRMHRRGPNQQEVDLCTDFLTAMGVGAKQANLLFDVEPLNRFECCFLNTAAKGKQLADDVNFDKVGILYDTHYASIEENSVYGAITALGSRLNYFQVSESHGTGAVDWTNSFRPLKDMNYKGWLVLESFAKDEVVKKGFAPIQNHLAN